MRSTAAAEARRRRAGRRSPRHRRPNRPPPERTEIEAETSLPRRGGADLVGDIHRHGAVGGEREAPVAGLVDAHVEADAAADEAAGDPHVRAGDEPVCVGVLEVEGDGRPAADGVRVGQQVEHDIRVGVDMGGGRPCPHGGERSPPGRRLSSPLEVILPLARV